MEAIEDGADSYYKLVENGFHTGVREHINYAVEKGFVIKGRPQARKKIPLKLTEKGKELLRWLNGFFH